jgi:hypothetical protein
METSFYNLADIMKKYSVYWLYKIQPTKLLEIYRESTLIGYLIYKETKTRVCIVDFIEVNKNISLTHKYEFFKQLFDPKDIYIVVSKNYKHLIKGKQSLVAYTYETRYTKYYLKNHSTKKRFYRPCNKENLIVYDIGFYISKLL